MKNLIKNYVANSSSKTVYQFGQYDSKYKLDDTRKTLMNIKEQARNKPYRINDILSPIREEYDSDYDHYKNMPFTIKMHGTGQVHLTFPSYLAIDKIYFDYYDGTNETQSYFSDRLNTISSKTLYDGQWVSISIIWDTSSNYRKSLVFFIEGDNYTVTCTSSIWCSCKYEVYGNLKSLYSNIAICSFAYLFADTSYDTFDNLHNAHQYNEFSEYFSEAIYDIELYDYSNLIDAFNLVLPEPSYETNYNDSDDYKTPQYEGLFAYCYYLKRGPKIIKHTLKQNYMYVYKRMFYDCNSLLMKATYPDINWKEGKLLNRVSKKDLEDWVQELQ